MMLTQIAIKMKGLICLLVLLNTLSISAQKGSNEGYDIYIVYQETGDIFTKPIQVKKDKLQFISYRLNIPNQKRPTWIFSFERTDSLQLNTSVKGVAGGGFDYHFYFLYSSKKNKRFFIKKNEYIENKLFLNYILSSNLDIFDEVLKNADSIYILEKTDKKGYRYLAREVSFSIPRGL